MLLNTKLPALHSANCDSVYTLLPSFLHSFSAYCDNVNGYVPQCTGDACMKVWVKQCFVPFSFLSPKYHTCPSSMASRDTSTDTPPIPDTHTYLRGLFMSDCPFLSLYPAISLSCAFLPLFFSPHFLPQLPPFTSTSLSFYSPHTAPSLLLFTLLLAFLSHSVYFSTPPVHYYSIISSYSTPAPSPYFLLPSPAPCQSTPAVAPSHGFHRLPRERGVPGPLIFPSPHR